MSITASSIKTSVRRTYVPAEWYMAKSVLGVRTAKFGPRPVYGFAMDNTEEKAVARSQYEVLERIHAYYDVFIHSMGKRDFLPAYHWESHEPCGHKPAGEVLLAHPQQAPYLDANGLAWHTDLGEAIAHGLLEVVERHLNAKIWYEGDPLHRISSLSLANQPLQLDVYTTVDKVPFAMAVIRSINRDVMACGTSVALSLQQAVGKATQEAFMILDGFLHNDMGNANSETSRTKILSMREPAFIKPVLEYLDGLVTDILVPNKVLKVREIIENTGGLNPSDGHYCLLESREDAVAIRAFCTGAMNPKFHPKRGQVPEDPFC